jgi:hypothetical protein
MLVEYFLAGPLSDLQMAERLGLPESRISARRSGLMDRRLVVWVEDVEGPYKAPNGKYGLSGYGREVAGELAKATI